VERQTVTTFAGPISSAPSKVVSQHSESALEVISDERTQELLKGKPCNLISMWQCDEPSSAQGLVKTFGRGSIVGFRAAAHSS
jgi:hypothetical protein